MTTRRPVRQCPSRGPLVDYGDFWFCVEDDGHDGDHRSAVEATWATADESGR